MTASVEALGHGRSNLLSDRPLDWVPDPVFMLDLGQVAPPRVWIAVRKQRSGAAAQTRLAGVRERLSIASLALEQCPHVTERARRKPGGLEAGTSELVRFGRETASALAAVDSSLVAEHAERFLNQFGQREEFV